MATLKRQNADGSYEYVLGLGKDLENVDNTSDLDKPVSTKQQLAIDASLQRSKQYTDQKVSEITSGALPDGSIPLSKLENNVPTLDENGNVLDGNGNIVEGKVKSVNGQTGDVIIDTSEIDTKINTIENSILAINNNIGDKSTLLTTEKSDIVNSINELFTNANNGKSSIANAIGLPTSPSDTFSDLATAITTAKTDIANAITNKGVSATDDDTFVQLKTKIENIQGGENATATSSDILANKTAVVNQQLVTGTMTNQGAKIYTPTISNQTIESGYHNGSGYVKGDSNLTASNIKSGVSIFGVTGNVPTSDSATASASEILTGKTALVKGNLVTGTMTNQGAKTYTPSTSTQYIPAGYHNGSGYVAGNSNLTASNIKSGVSIFGVTGSYSGAGLQYYTTTAGRSVGSKKYEDFTLYCGFVPKYWYCTVKNISLADYNIYNTLTIGSNNVDINVSTIDTEWGDRSIIWDFGFDTSNTYTSGTTLYARIKFSMSPYSSYITTEWHVFG